MEALWALLKDIGTVVGAFFTGDLVGHLKEQNDQLQKQVDGDDEIRRIHEKNNVLSDSQLDGKL